MMDHHGGRNLCCSKNRSITRCYGKADLKPEKSGPERGPRKKSFYIKAHFLARRVHMSMLPLSGYLTDRPGHGGRTYVLWLWLGPSRTAWPSGALAGWQAGGWALCEEPRSNILKHNMILLCLFLDKPTLGPLGIGVGFSERVWCEYDRLYETTRE